MATRCAFQLCKHNARGLVRMRKMDIGDAYQTSEVPLCVECADEVQGAVRRRIRVHLTQEGVLYLGDLDEQIPRRT